jgi:hypothetical protein
MDARRVHWLVGALPFGVYGGLAGALVGSAIAVLVYASRPPTANEPAAVEQQRAPRVSVERRDSDNDEPALTRLVRKQLELQDVEGATQTLQTIPPAQRCQLVSDLLVESERRSVISPASVAALKATIPSDQSDLCTVEVLVTIAGKEAEGEPGATVAKETLRRAAQAHERYQAAQAQERAERERRAAEAEQARRIAPSEPAGRFRAQVDPSPDDEPAASAGASALMLGLFPIVLAALGSVLSVMLKPALEAVGRAVVVPAVARAMKNPEMLRTVSSPEGGKTD